MDIVTHGVLGALVVQSVTPAKNLRAATLIGFFAALLPDLDVLINSTTDPLLVLEYHRHFTHSLFFAPLAALLITFISAPLLAAHFSRTRLFGLILLAYSSACLLDLCTSYGTYVLWPLIDDAFALSIIAVVDPVFTTLLAIAMISAWRGRRQHRAKIGLILGLSYLALGWLQHERAATAAGVLAEERGLTAVDIQVKPTMGNLLLYRAVTLVPEEQLYVDAIRAGIQIHIYPGEQRRLVVIDELTELPPESRAYRDLLRYQQLNAPLLIAHSEDPWLIGDARYAMLPTRADPLWGLQVDPLRPDTVPEFVTRRKLTPAMRQAFITMLMGKNLHQQEKN